MKKILASMFLWFSGASVSMAEISSGGGQVSSGGQQQGQITLSNPLGSQSFLDIVTKILGALFTLSIPIVSIMVMVGGYYILTAAGNEENLKKGRQTITYAAIGFAVILLAGGVVNLIRSLFGI